ncbi:uncharacterized protein BDW47DRAFT_23221 [Aspergillus candidus]|uniref:Secreted protein n=1 Tax=Aspergillus candidus TaxID=41067 RepID=A0A2I2FCX4_ASPCN|nr:hypothetical protein BDW47DRAFT_23221 [Aspergillus candidus]PLB38485.1 hypothetical protein BDW47DRAFT_23221 [Aspergillus candidus]
MRTLYESKLVVAWISLFLCLRGDAFLVSAIPIPPEALNSPVGVRKGKFSPYNIAPPPRFMASLTCLVRYNASAQPSFCDSSF